MDWLNKDSGRLHPAVRVVPVSGGVEIFDQRTGLRLALDGVQPEDFEAVRMPSKLAGLVDNLALCDSELPTDAVCAQQQLELGGEDGSDLDRLQALLEFVVARVPYYRNRRDSYSLKLRSREDLQRLPRINKVTLRASFHELVADDVDLSDGIASGRLEIGATSGTTSEKSQAVIDYDLNEVHDDYAALWGLEKGGTPKTAILTSPACLGQVCHRAESTYESRLRFENTLLLPSPQDLFGIERALLEQIAEEAWRFGPDWLFVNPVYLHVIADRAREWGIELPPVKLILTSYQYMSELQTRILGDAFHVPLRNVYAATELGGCHVAVECRSSRWHLREDHSLIEVVPPSGQADTAGVGAIVVSTLASRTMPLVRYVLGDVACFTDEGCDCALGHTRTLQFHGRMADLLYLGARHVTTRQVDEVISDTSGVSFYQCLQTGESALSVRLVRSADGEPLDADLLTDRLRDRFGVREVRISEVKRLSPEPSGKFRLTGARIAIPEFLA